MSNKKIEENYKSNQKERKNIIASNRLPISILKQDGKIEPFASSGGLATGLKSFHKERNGVWIGWPGFSPNNEKEKETTKEILSKENCHPVYIDQRLIENYYDGFSNATIWPLFHYFSGYAVFRSTFWRAYLEVNRIFAKEILSIVGENDTIWVHDYQLMLLPQLLKEKIPSLKIGFFLHIPFPSFEIFRVLPWRKEILKGLIGSDLIGFHTNDYAKHFMDSVQSLNLYQIDGNTINKGSEKSIVDVFPMGIDFKKFNDYALQIKDKIPANRSKERQDLDELRKQNPNLKLILSIDRLDYTKGILQRLRSFSFFLRTRRNYLENVSLIMLVVPSRERVEEYQKLKSEIEEAVTSINGEFGSINWTPVIYFYRSIPFNSLVELYNAMDIALLTPLRDGMNLVAKEFVASQTKKNGVLILSEMAGAAEELKEAILVNPNNIVEVSDSIHLAIKMSEQEKIRRIKIMQEKLETNNVYKWAESFLESLQKPKNYLLQDCKKLIFKDYCSAKQKILFLDYDGTLVDLEEDYKSAFPDKKLTILLQKLSDLENTTVVIVTGRSQEFMDKCFGDLPLEIIAEHGAYQKTKDMLWQKNTIESNSWKKKVKSIFEEYCHSSPKTEIEEKSHTLVWHYRKLDDELGESLANDVLSELNQKIKNKNLEILKGKKIIEVKNKSFNKGLAVEQYLKTKNYDFVLSFGDDKTDETMFEKVNQLNGYSIKVGIGDSLAEYRTKNSLSVREFLEELICLKKI